MLTISLILGELIQQYLDEATRSERDCRLVVPGLTNNIGREIHEYLCSRNVDSYLVVGESSLPDEKKRWIRPIGLTSKRIGSFVAIVSPGQLSHIQDSIRGSGGAIRSLAFSEEWPWIDNGSEAFRFDGLVLDQLVNRYTSNKSEQDWLRGFIVSGLLKDTRTCSWRAELLLEVILGRFEPNLYPDLGDIRYKFLFHAGVPSPEGSIGDAGVIIREASRLCQKINDRRQKEELIREQAHAMIPDVIHEDSLRPLFSESLDVFLDGLGTSKNTSLGLLSFHSCWGSDNNDPTHWLRLNSRYLAELFNVRERPEAQVTFRLDCPRGIISGDQKTLVTFADEHIYIHVNYKIPEGFNNYKWELRVLGRSKCFVVARLDTDQGTVILDLDTDNNLGRRNKRIPLRIALFADDNVRADERFYLHLCGEERPQLVLVDSIYEVVDPTPESNDDTPDNKFEIEQPVHVYLFDYDNGNPEIKDIDENQLNVIEVKPGIFRLSHPVDPSHEASGQTSIVCTFSEKKVYLSFEAKDIEKGEFTIEDELRCLLASSKGVNNRQLIDTLSRIFSGASTEPYLKLGKIDDASRRRMKLASQMSSRIGWRPLLTNLISADYEKSGAVGDYINYLGNVDCSGFENVSLPEEALELLRLYSEARAMSYDKIISSVDYNNIRLDHPTYALHPIFVEKEAAEIERYLVTYLKSYIRVLDYLNNHHDILGWSQIFVLTYLDCVVHWQEGTLKNSLFLVGPWHPLVLSKRFMVQNALYERAQRLLNDENGKQFRQLSVLLEKIPGFRWIPGLRPDDRLVEPIYVSATSDPAWHIALRTDMSEIMSQTEFEGLIGICDKLRNNLGLDGDLLMRGPDEIASSCLKSYLRAFPSRRTVSMRIRKGYSTTKVVKAIDNFLHTEEGPTSTGMQLPGGVSLFLEACSERIEDVQWSNPPLCIYDYTNDIDCFRDHNPDIYVLSPSPTLTFRTGKEKRVLPRGRGLGSVFSQPLDWLTEGQELIPKSVNYSFDTASLVGESLGETFITAAGRISEFLPDQVSIVSSVNLPQRLNSQWAITPGGGLDPAVFVKYVRDGAERSIQERALWDYKVDIAEKQKSFYILSTIPKGFTIAVNGFFQRETVAKEFIAELGSLGIAIGGEALKSGRHALGVIGLVGAVRMFQGSGNRVGPLHNSQERIGFLIPVDSFIPFFGNPDGSIDNEEKRADLLAIQLVIPNSDGGKLKISACGVESKFVSATFSQTMAHSALGQARASVDRMQDLVDKSLSEGAIPERLGILELIRFGLRISSPNTPQDISNWVEVERIIYESILRGQYEYEIPKHKAVLVTTEGQFPGVSEANILPEGFWIRLNKDHWPGINDSPQLDEIRRQLSGIFGEKPGEIRANQVKTLATAEDSPKPQPESVPSGDDSHGPDVIQGELVKDNQQPIDIQGRPSRSPSALQRIIIGVDDGRRSIYYDPQSPVDPLDNLNIMVTGSSGTGKTQLLKYLILQLRNQGKEVLILDFKNDFASDSTFAEYCNIDRVFVTFDGLPYNPLIPYPIKHPATGELFIQCAQHIAGIASVLKRTYGLGTQQQADVKNAITAAFIANGIQATGSVKYDDDMNFPDFSSVGGVLRNDNLQAYNRLDPLFTLNLFRQDFHENSFQSLVNRSVILDLSQIPSNEIKNALAQMVVMSAHAYYNSQVHSGSIRQVLIFDEAHRVISSEFIAQLVRECRAYGVGTILSSQNPSDFPSEISASMATKILHSNGRDMDKVKAIVQLIGCEGREIDVSNLDRFQAFLDNRHYPHTLIRTMNYPIYLVWSYLCQHNEGTREELSNINGLDTTKLPIENIIHQLEILGLVEEYDGHVRLLVRE